MSTGRALGLGLIGLGGVLGGWLVLSMVVTAASGNLTSGGALLWLLLALVVGVPLVGAGWFVLQRGKQEQAEAAEFAGRQRVLEQDRLFRARIAAEADQQAQRLAGLARRESRLERAAARLRQVAAQLGGPGYDQAAWYEAVRLTDADVAALAQYDTLVSERLRRIAARADALELHPDGTGRADEPAEILRAVQAWERDLDQRLELLRGERAPTVAPSTLLTSAALSDGVDAVAALGLGDAVGYELDDYLVELTITYFAGGRSWKLHRLGSDGQRWLYVGPGALSLAMLQAVEPVEAAGSPDEVRVDGGAYQIQDSGEASVTIENTAGPIHKLTVEYRHCTASSGELYWLERWPDGQRAYRGAPIRPAALEIWPRERTAPA